SVCCGCAFLPRWRLYLIQSSSSSSIVTSGSLPTGFQSARWLLPPLSFGNVQEPDRIGTFSYTCIKPTKEFPHETHYSLQSHQYCAAFIIFSFFNDLLKGSRAIARVDFLQSR